MQGIFPRFRKPLFAKPLFGRCGASQGSSYANATNTHGDLYELTLMQLMQVILINKLAREVLSGSRTLGEAAANAPLPLQITVVHVPDAKRTRLYYTILYCTIAILYTILYYTIPLSTVPPTCEGGRQRLPRRRAPPLGPRRGRRAAGEEPRGSGQNITHQRLQK